MKKLEDLLTSNRRKREQAKRKMGNRKKVWTKQSLAKATIIIDD